MLGIVLISDLWREYVVDPGRQGIFLVLAAFLVSFAFIRTSARLIQSPRAPWWPGSVVTDDGVHLHHLVWGIVLMLAGGTIGFAQAGQSPWFEMTAILFGFGAGLTFDEFALWIYLKDVYWAREGRRSIDAVAVTAAFMGLVFLGVNPLHVTGNNLFAVLVSLGYSLGVIVVSGICFAKSRFLPGFATWVLPPLGLWAVLRLAQPGSAWARWRYGSRDPVRQARAEARFPPDRRSVRLLDRVRASIGGIQDPGRPGIAPPQPDEPAEPDATELALHTVRARARAEAEARHRAQQR